MKPHLLVRNLFISAAASGTGTVASPPRWPES